jgi:hypothetical protein
MSNKYLSYCLMSFLLAILVLSLGCSSVSNKEKEHLFEAAAKNDNYRLIYEATPEGTNDSIYLLFAKSGNISEAQYEKRDYASAGTTFLNEYQYKEDSILCMKTVFNRDDLLRKAAAGKPVQVLDGQSLSRVFFDGSDLGYCSHFNNNETYFVATLLSGSFFNKEQIKMKKKEVNGNVLFCFSQESKGDLFKYDDGSNELKTISDICMNKDTAFVYSIHSLVIDNKSKEVVYNITLSLHKEETITSGDILNQGNYVMDNFKCNLSAVSFDLFSLSDFGGSEINLISRGAVGNVTLYSETNNLGFFDNKSITLLFKNPFMGSSKLDICIGDRCRRLYDKCDGDTLLEGVCDVQAQRLVYKNTTCSCGCFDGKCVGLVPAEISFQKKVIKPDTDGDHIVEWEVEPSLKAKDSAVELRNVSLWVTASPDPKDIYKNLTKQQILNVVVKPGEQYFPDVWVFNYTDGTSPAYPPPIVWIQEEWCGID